MNIDTLMKERTFSHKLKLIQHERTPEVIKQEMVKKLFTPKQKEVISIAHRPDLKLLIHHGGTGSGKTYVNNYLFLQALKQVRAEADRTLGKTFKPKVILAGYKRENITNNIIMPLVDEFGIEVKYDQDGNFELFGVKVVTTFLNSAQGEASIRGMDAWFIYVNEASKSNRAAFAELFKRLRGGSKPYIIADTNPEHPMHWLKLHYIDKAKDTKGWYAVHSSPQDNPYLEDNYIETLMNLPAGAERDRALGEWATGQGAVYKHFHDETHYIQKDKLPPRSSFTEFFTGVDWGWKDPTVFVLFGKTNGKTYLIEEHSASHTHMEQWQALAQKWMNTYGSNMPFYCDSAEQDRIDKLYQIGANAQNAVKNINMGIESVAALLEAEELFVVEDGVDMFKKEIGAYQWNEQKGTPVDKDNHVMDAMRYAIHTHKENGNNTVSWY